METRALSRQLILILSAPFILVSGLAEIFNAWNVREDIGRCLRTIDLVGGRVPTSFVGVLVAAEDHRNHLHIGVDPIAIIRAAYSFVRGRSLQGASTIEQQFVRVVTNRYERTLIRKVREQAVAIAVSRRRPKTLIASAYLAIAFYGSRYEGLNGLRRVCGHELNRATPLSIRGMIARLKYPEPMHPSAAWRDRHRLRAEYIAARHGAANNALQPTEQTGASFACAKLAPVCSAAELGR